MNKDFLRQILHDVQNNQVDIESAIDKLKLLPFEDIGHTKVDLHRQLRQGYAEVIYGAGKTVQQVVDIVHVMMKQKSNILVTRCSDEMFNAVQAIYPQTVFHKTGAMFSITNHDVDKPETSIAVITAGTSDNTVAEEAAVTAEFLGNRVERIFDVGVAGIHRLFSQLDRIMEARVLVVVAGMEGALASVVGGLIDKPIIAVPTSVGYGANFQGVSALLGMLTSCASGVSVVNIDNGFGAGYQASMINKL